MTTEERKLLKERARTKTCWTCAHSEAVTGSLVEVWCWVDAVTTEEWPEKVGHKHTCDRWKGRNDLPDRDMGEHPLTITAREWADGQALAARTDP